MVCGRVVDLDAAHAAGLPGVVVRLAVALPVLGALAVLRVLHLRLVHAREAHVVDTGAAGRHAFGRAPVAAGQRDGDVEDIGAAEPVVGDLELAAVAAGARGREAIHDPAAAGLLRIHRDLVTPHGDHELRVSVGFGDGAADALLALGHPADVPLLGVDVGLADVALRAARVLARGGVLAAVPVRTYR